MFPDGLAYVAVGLAYVRAVRIFTGTSYTPCSSRGILSFGLLIKDQIVRCCLKAALMLCFHSIRAIVSVLPLMYGSVMVAEY